MDEKKIKDQDLHEDDDSIKVTDPEANDEISVDDLIDKLADLQKKAEAERHRAEEMTDFARRVQAEFDNYRKRSLETAHKSKDEATAEVLVKILPVLDVISTALGMIDDEKVAEGVVMIRAELEKILAHYGVVEIEAEGKPFDPRVHEAIMQQPAENERERDTVKQVFQKGYKMGDKVIRPARVIVSK